LVGDLEKKDEFPYTFKTKQSKVTLQIVWSMSSTSTNGHSSCFAIRTNCTKTWQFEHNKMKKYIRKIKIKRLNLYILSRLMNTKQVNKWKIINAMFITPLYSLKVPSLINLFLKKNSFTNEMDDS
jgi:hypothetical protein